MKSNSRSTAALLVALLAGLSSTLSAEVTSSGVTVDHPDNRAAPLNSGTIPDAAATGASDRLASAEKNEDVVPKGLTDSAWQGIRQAYEQRQHAACWLWELQLQSFGFTGPQCSVNGLAPTLDGSADVESGKDRVSRSIGQALDPDARARAAKRIQGKARRLAKNGPKRYDKPQEAMDFFYQQRLAPGTTVLPLEKLKTALVGLKQLEQALRDSFATPQAVTIAPWTEIGPGNIGGRTRAIVIDPTNPLIMYAAGVAGGIWKSTDGGAGWTATDDLMQNIAVASLAMDPTNPLVLYAGTGEGFFNADAVRGLGIFKTTDGGATWNQLSGTVSGVPFGAFFRVNDIVVSPANPGRVYAATRYGVWRSTDAGATWSIMLANPFFIGGLPASNGSSVGCLDLAIRTDTAPGADVMLASFGSFGPDGLFRSADSGVTWTQVGTSLDIRIANQGRMQLDIAPSNNNTVYVSMADNGNTGNATGTMVNVFRSLDGGVTWSPRLNFGNSFSPFLLSNILFSSVCGGVDNFAQGWYGNIIKVDPADPNILWVGGIDLFRSNDGGANFGLTSYWWFDPSDSRYVHADQHAITFHPNYNGSTNQIMYSGSDGGLARTDNARAATTTNACGGSPFPSVAWTGLNNGYGVTQFYWGDAAKGSSVYGGGCQDNGTILVSSSVTPESWIEIMGGDGGYFSIDPNNSNVMYAEFQNFPTINKSTNGGLSFFSATSGITDDDGLFISPFELAQSNSQVLWTGGSRAWRSVNGGSSWTLGSSNLPGTSTISAIAISDSDPNVVYLGYTNGAVARTINGLSPVPTWNTFGSANGLSAGWVSGVTIDPQNPDVAYATFSTFNVPHILRTVNGGSSWASIDGPTAAGVPDIPVHHLAIRSCDSTQLFVGSELGAFMSDDDGVTWIPVNIGLAHTVVEKLDFQDADTLVAFTHGRGAFVTTLSPSCGVECDLGTDNCDINATCTSIPGGFTCTCNLGFSGDGVTCLPLNPAVKAAAPHDLPKVKYISIDASINGTRLLAIKITETTTGKVKWAGTPFNGPDINDISALSPTPVIMDWSAFSVLHLTGCIIQPFGVYEITFVDDPLGAAISSAVLPASTACTWGDIQVLAGPCDAGIGDIIEAIGIITSSPLATFPAPHADVLGDVVDGTLSLGDIIATINSATSAGGTPLGYTPLIDCP